ncbi:MAG TPA: hypothetical protein PK373_07105 [Sedimentisphaerales bacterium]|nr:hypothetical protein [Sedimentisphaerales bacterium]HQG48839.1 hypothetical protein [Sedimentisphaerales bacterium]
MNLPAYVDGVPNLCGSEAMITDGLSQAVRPPGGSKIDWGAVTSAYAIALHMHQPLIPDPDQELGQAPILSNLKHMMDHPHVGDNHNAKVFHWCYKRMGEFIPRLVAEGRQPRVMLDYSGTLLHGLYTMGLHDVFESLRTITCDPRYRSCVEWLGSAWGHPVAPSTPVQDYRLHVQTWRHFFAALFGVEALARVRGFSPAEMALPNHPDVFYEFVRTLKDCGYRWVIVQEHTVEHVEDGGALKYAHRPHKLVARNSCGETLAITAIIKTQGSDTKLVGQMQPYYEARGLGRIELGGKAVPSLVTQIADGENGGVMMNEFPPKYEQVMRESSGTQTPPVNVGEYLDYLDSLGVRETDFPQIQPIFQHRIWQRFKPGGGPEALAATIEQLAREDSRFHVEGGSWTNNISWVRGYQDVLQPMEAASARFNEVFLRQGVPSSDPRYRNALLHLLTSQTSCYRYWGQGLWADWGRELCRRTIALLENA